MKARLEKKLSKKLFEIAPTIFRDAWILSDEPTALAYEQGSCVSVVFHVGGDLDYFGEPTDAITLWEWFTRNWHWIGDFNAYPEWHDKHPHPNTEGFKPTTKNLLKIAAEAEMSESLENLRNMRLAKWLCDPETK